MQKETEHDVAFPYAQNEDYYSVSSITTAMDCLLKHWFKYNLHLQRDDSVHLTLGRCIHNAIAFYHEKIITNKLTEPQIASVFQIFDESWEKSIAEGNEVGKDSKEQEYFYHLGLLLIDRYLRGRSKIQDSKVLMYKDANMLNAKPAIELEFRVPIVDLKTGKSIIDKDLYGFIDLIEYDKKYGISIWDHKTASRDYSRFKILTDIQLPLYAYVFRYLCSVGAFPELPANTREDGVGFNIMMKPNRNVRIVGIDHSKILTAKFKKTHIIISDAELTGLFNIIKSVHHHIKEGEPYPSWGSDCSWKCPWNAECIQYRNGTLNIVTDNKNREQQELEL